MLARLRKTHKDGDEGFTLIELLVVIIIIGILAAIAIPTFLKQREKGWKAAVKSDMKNAITAEESYATDNNGTYTSNLAELVSQGFNKTDQVTITPTAGTPATSFTMTGKHGKLGACTLSYDSATGVTTEAGC